VLKVNRIVATEGHDGKPKGKRDAEEDAEAIYSIHGRANTDSRLDARTVDSPPRSSSPTLGFLLRGIVSSLPVADAPRGRT